MGIEAAVAADDAVVVVGKVLKSGDRAAPGAVVCATGGFGDNSSVGAVCQSAADGSFRLTMPKGPARWLKWTIWAGAKDCGFSSQSLTPGRMDKDFPILRLPAKGELVVALLDPANKPVAQSEVWVDSFV